HRSRGWPHLVPIPLAFRLERFEERICPRLKLLRFRMAHSIDDGNIGQVRGRVGGNVHQCSCLGNGCVTTPSAPPASAGRLTSSTRGTAAPVVTRRWRLNGTAYNADPVV